MGLGIAGVLRSRRGIGVVFPVICLTVIVLVGMASIQMWTSSKRWGERLYTDSAMQSLVNTIDSLLKNPDSCRIALGGPMTVGGATTAVAQVLSNTPAMNAATQTFPTTQFQIYNSTQTAVFLAQGQNFGPLVITSLQLQKLALLGNDSGTDLGVNTGAGSIFYTILTVAAQDVKGTIGGRNQTNSQIRLTVKVDAANHIIGCTSMTFMGSDFFAPPYPLGANYPGSPNPQPPPICQPGFTLYSDGPQVRCVRTVCPAGKSPKAFWADGNLQCQ